MTANTSGSYLTERADRRIVLPAKVATFAEQRKIEDMPGELPVGRADAGVKPHKNNNQGKI
jgi:hypothetical protein